MPIDKKNKKFGLGIVTFEGTEHLESIISEIKDLLDYVVIAKQNISYCGNKIDPEDDKEIDRLKNIGLVDEIIIYEPELDIEDRHQETNKRNMTIDFLQSKGCDYVLITDSDEIYNHDDFERAIQYIVDNKLEITYCRYINYYHDLEHYIAMPFKCYVSFFFKSCYRYVFECQDFREPSDPTRRVHKPLDVENYIFDWNDIKMHHMSWIRKNIRKKIENWSAKKFFANDVIEKSVEEFNNFHPDKDYAYLLFNVPQHRVSICKLPHAFVHPKNNPVV